MMGSPKKLPSMLKVEIVKLCSPLNQRVISLGLFPIASANCFFVIHFFCISSSKRFEIWKESRASALSSGVMFRSSLNDVFAFFITQIFHQCGFHFPLSPHNHPQDLILQSVCCSRIETSAKNRHQCLRLLQITGRILLL